MNLTLIEKHLKVVGENIQLGLYGPAFVNGVGNIRPDLRSVQTVNDDDILVKYDGDLSNLQVKESGGYTHLDPATESELINRNKVRSTNRQEIEEDFIGIYKVVGHITTEFPTNPIEGYYIVTEGVDKDSLYKYINGEFKKVSLYDYKFIIPESDIPNYRKYKFYYYVSNGTPKWVPISNNKTYTFYD